MIRCSSRLLSAAVVLILLCARIAGADTRSTGGIGGPPGDAPSPTPTAASSSGGIGEPVDTPPAEPPIRRRSEAPPPTTHRSDEAPTPRQTADVPTPRGAPARVSSPGYGYTHRPGVVTVNWQSSGSAGSSRGDGTPSWRKCDWTFPYPWGRR